LYWEHEGNAAIRVGDQKLVRLGLRGSWELFDLQSDRTEQHNLADAHPQRVQQLDEQWRAWAKSANVLPKPPARKKTRGKPKAKKVG
jgi:arylsulfatase